MPAPCLMWWEDVGGLSFEVSDDGAGFASNGHSDGAGLTNMRDRLGAVGGSLKVESDAHGTRINGVVPVSGNKTNRTADYPVDLPGVT